MKHTFTALFIFLISLPVLSDSDSHKAATEEMLLALNIDATMANMAENIKDTQARKLRTLGLPANAQPIIDEYLNKTMEVLLSAYKWENIKAQYIDAYVSVYTENEINDLLAFFKSKSGKKYIEKTPEMDALILKITDSRIQYMKPQIQTLNEEFKAKLSAVDNK